MAFLLARRFFSGLATLFGIVPFYGRVSFFAGHVLNNCVAILFFQLLSELVVFALHALDAQKFGFLSFSFGCGFGGFDVFENFLKNSFHSVLEVCTCSVNQIVVHSIVLVVDLGRGVGNL